VRGNAVALNKYRTASCVHGDFRSLGDSLQIAVVFPKQLPGQFNIRKINRDGFVVRIVIHFVYNELKWNKVPMP
jgi:hypothetical protein